MSRGLGKWESLILEALNNEGWCVVNDLGNGNHSQRTALHRAAHRLKEKGLLDIWYRPRPQTKTYMRYHGLRFGYEESHQDRRTMVAVLPNHYPPVWDYHARAWVPIHEGGELVEEYDPVAHEEGRKAWLEAGKALGIIR